MLFRRRIIVWALLILSYAAFLASCAEKKVEVPVIQVPKAFQNDDFELDLEEGWVPDHDEDSYGWEDTRGLQEIRVPPLLANQALDSQALEKSLQQLLVIRKKVLKEVSSGTAVIGETDRTMADGILELRLIADDKKNNVQTCYIVRAKPDRIGQLSFHKYSPQISNEEFKKRCEQISSRFHLR